MGHVSLVRQGVKDPWAGGNVPKGAHYAVMLGVLMVVWRFV